MSSLFTPQQVQEWLEESAAIDAQTAALARRKLAVQKLLEAAELIGVTAEKASSDVATAPNRDPTDDVNFAPEQSDRVPHGTWTGVIRKVLAEAEYGLSQNEAKLRIAVAYPELGERLKASDTSFYGAVNKLYLADEIVKHHGRIFLPEKLSAYRAALAAGKVSKPAALSDPRRSDFQVAVLAFLEGRPNGSSSGDIIAHLRKTPEFARRIGNNPTYAYNVFAKLVHRNEMRKHDGLYYPAARKSMPAAAHVNGSAP